jgi:hypothetical protein
MSKNAISIEILFKQDKRFCSLPGRSFEGDPRQDIIKMICHADPKMTPGMFTSLWLGTSVLYGIIMVIFSTTFFILAKSLSIQTSVRDNGMITAT